MACHIFHAFKIHLPMHSFSLQGTFWESSPLHDPPWSSSTIFSLVLVRVPSPQSAEHPPISHSLHVQLTKLNLSWYHFYYVSLWNDNSMYNITYDTPLMSLDSKIFTWALFFFARHILRMLSVARSSIGFFHNFCSCVSSCTIPTVHWTFPSIPFTPLAINS